MIVFKHKHSYAFGTLTKTEKKAHYRSVVICRKPGCELRVGRMLTNKHPMSVTEIIEKLHALNPVLVPERFR